MAKKSNNKKRRKKETHITKDISNEIPVDISQNNTKPFVSICTPTFNRRPFIPYMVKCFEHQDYPKERMEWIIIDDGNDKIEELVSHIPQVKYFKYDNKMTLGKKRNLMHTKTSGDILVYMDDDDFYPPDRVSHAVEMLQANPSALCAGCSEIYIYFKHIEQLYQFGPYTPTHATAGTFAFRKELLLQTSYEDTASLAEEKKFLKDYTVPFVQLNPMKTIVVFSHQHNTFDKRKLLEEMNDYKFCKPSGKTVDMFVKSEELRDFYMNQIDTLLQNYEPGRPAMKPDVLEQIIEIERKRRRDAEQFALKQHQVGITMQQEGQPPKVLNNDEVLTLLKQQQTNINILLKQDKEKSTELERLHKVLLKLNEKMLSIECPD